MSTPGRTAAIAAAEKGLIVVYPTANQLFIDIDDAAGLTMFERAIDIVKIEIPCTWVQTLSPSAKPHHFHITVTLTRDVSPLERICLQAMLGSDRMREVLSWRALGKRDPDATVFFELPSAPAPGDVSLLEDEDALPV